MGWHQASPIFLFAESRWYMNRMTQIPFWERYTMSVEEAAAYFRVGENKLRKLISEDNDADYILWNGNRPQIKRKKFEEYIDRHNLI